MVHGLRPFCCHTLFSWWVSYTAGKASVFPVCPLAEGHWGRWSSGVISMSTGSWLSASLVDLEALDCWLFKVFVEDYGHMHFIFWCTSVWLLVICVHHTLNQEKRSTERRACVREISLSLTVHALHVAYTLGAFSTRFYPSIQTHIHILTAESTKQGNSQLVRGSSGVLLMETSRVKPFTGMSWYRA